MDTLDSIACLEKIIKTSSEISENAKKLREVYMEFLLSQNIPYDHANLLLEVSTDSYTQGPTTIALHSAQRLQERLSWYNGLQDYLNSSMRHALMFHEPYGGHIATLVRPSSQTLNRSGSKFSVHGKPVNVYYASHGITHAQFDKDAKKEFEVGASYTKDDLEMRAYLSEKGTDAHLVDALIDFDESAIFPADFFIEDIPENVRQKFAEKSALYSEIVPLIKKR